MSRVSKGKKFRRFLLNDSSVRFASALRLETTKGERAAASSFTVAKRGMLSRPTEELLFAVFNIAPAPCSRHNDSEECIQSERDISLTHVTGLQKQ